ncbi:hypothetical protein RFI_02455 [Reticulomyxa filosa]|uniref:Uncharacterized protein n=1 Tax=Reticulomyxa filosa TaxID=46433 RepID=X6P8W6_RETFI|nr:hypothetical protein RFI_02455 [Reticulomyxa filosa]|eukprot:ETO34636.1 hypothetical protein RFI_02455 [Reticulomyxa filosa]
MADQNTQKPIETQTSFQSLKDLPTPFTQAQCVPHEHEFLICRGKCKRDCYSYHLLKNEYKFICRYPDDVYLKGHCVVKLTDSNKNSNQITLLSFDGEYKHTLTMKYVSVWNNDNNENEMDKLKKSNNYNKWIPFTDNHNNQIHIGGAGDHYEGVRAVIGGSNNNLL